MNNRAASKSFVAASSAGVPYLIYRHPGFSDSSLSKYIKNTAAILCEPEAKDVFFGVDLKKFNEGKCNDSNRIEQHETYCGDIGTNA
ncbi:hypothetical protein [Desulfovibrio fairfieldensis]|uniref:hypothetical protein n=1 Tax=Desulfovibrio fairfieldensis TaxID=44742 RepID=UPI001237647F|nr:hypothetical protein [Desulfovibrio fairfieldensis]